MKSKINFKVDENSQLRAVGQRRKAEIVHVEQNPQHRSTVRTDRRMSAGGQMAEYLSHFRFVDHVADHHALPAGLVAEQSLDVLRPVSRR